MKRDTMKKITRQDSVFMEHLMILLDGNERFKETIQNMINEFKVRDTDTYEMKVDPTLEEYEPFF